MILLIVCPLPVYITLLPQATTLSPTPASPAGKNHSPSSICALVSINLLGAALEAVAAPTPSIKLSD